MEQSQQAQRWGSRPDSRAAQGVAPRRPMGFAYLHGQNYEITLGEDRLHVGGQYAIRFDEIRDVRITDISLTTSSRPWWTILLAVLLFPIGLLFLLIKDTRRVPQSTITVYTAAMAYPFIVVGRTTTDATTSGIR